jgi:hypothetical protein
MAAFEISVNALERGQTTLPDPETTNSSWSYFFFFLPYRKKHCHPMQQRP